MKLDPLSYRLLTITACALWILLGLVAAYLYATCQPVPRELTLPLGGFLGAFVGLLAKERKGQD